MNGDDTGGTQFLLLVIGAVLLWRHVAAWHRSTPWPAFLLGATAALGGLGFVFGSVSSGEEPEGVAAGVAVGIGVGLMGPVFRGLSPDGDADPVGTRPAVAVPAASLSLDDARDRLDDLAARGFCERYAAPNGAVRYRFGDFVPY